jgi:LPS export ABC transporter protein LptC
MKFFKTFLGIQILLPAFFFCITACENNIAVVNSITSATEKELPIESGKNVEIIYSDSAIVRAKLIAPELNRYAGKKPYSEMPKGMNVIFYDKNRNVQSKLTANYGIGFDAGNGMERMEANGNVIVINDKGEQLNTEHLTWNAVTKKIYTDKFVKITTKDEIIWGDGLEANQDFSQYQIKNVKGQIDVKDQDINGPEKKK